MCPIKNFRISQKKEDWITNDLLEILRDKDYFLSKAKKYNNPDDWNVARRLRNQAKKLTKHARADFVKTKLEENKNDTKTFWRIIKGAIPDSKVKNGKITLKDQTTGTTIEEQTTASYINNYFAGIGPKLAENVNDNWHYDGITYPPTFESTLITRNDILKLIKGINITKSSAIPHLSSRILKDLFLQIPDQLLHVMNLSILNSTFPSLWKIATVTPIPNEGDSTDVNNLRPISLLPLPGKLLEKAMHSQITKFLNDNSILTDK